MKEITCEELNENAFDLIGKDWMLFTAKKDGKVNTMTASCRNRTFSGNDGTFLRN